MEDEVGQNSIHENNFFFFPKASKNVVLVVLAELRVIKQFKM